MSSVSTFGAFTTARLAIYASMKGLDVTGHNIANINTRGYTRQALDQRSLRVNGSDRYVSPNDARVGSGVLCTGISQMRDPYLDIRYRNEVSSVGANEEKLDALDQISSILDEVAKNDGDGVIEKQFSDLLKKLDTLNQSVGQLENDTLVRASASALVSLLKSYSGSLDDVQKNLETGLKQDLDTVNNLLKNISELNNNIRKSEIYGDNALELRDQRNVYLDDLSKYMKIDVTYTTEQLGAGVEVQKMVIKLANSDKTTLVDGAYHAEMSVANSDYAFEVSELKDANGNIPDGSVATILTGDLKGSLQSSREMLTAAGEFSAPGSTTSPSTRGLPYYRAALDALANKFANSMNDANRPYQVDSKGNYLDAKGDVLTNGGKTLNKATELSDADKAYLQKNGNRVGGILFSNDSTTDNTAGITASNIAISKSWTTGATRITTSAVKPDAAGGGDLSTANDNLAHILALFNKDLDYVPQDGSPGADSKAVFFKGTFQKMLSNTTATLANDTSTTVAILNNYASAADQVNIGRDSVSSVDLNDEAANMMQYQKSYSAACRLLTTIDEALDKLINGTGVVGR